MKLQQRTIRSFIFYALAISLASVPLFYFVIQGISSRSIDEGLLLQKEDLVRKLNHSLRFDPFRWLEDFEPDIRLQPVQEFRQLDTLYTASFIDRRSGRMIPYRVLESIVLINGVPYSIQLKNSLLSKEDLIKSIVWVQAILMFLIAAGMFLINRRIEGRTWKPFYATLEKLRGYKIESGEKIEFVLTDIDEFQNLQRAIASLTMRNQQAYLAQKEFTENASHEMQSPLAVIQSKT